MSADRPPATVSPTINDFLDPVVCSCFPTAYHSLLCRKLKWSTLSITIALIILIVYASSGLYTLIDVTTLMAIEPVNGSNETTIFWSMLSSSEVIMLSWVSLSVYFFIVLLIIVLLCGIQWSKPWLLFLWSILMIVMLLADGIVTVLALREYQQRAHRPTKQVQILFVLMIIRLIALLCGIFITVFHFRRLNKTLSEYTDRQRMLFRYNADSASPSYNSSWAHADGLLNPPKDESIDLHEPEVPLQMTLPRAQLATIQRRPMSSMFHSRHFDQPDFYDYHNQKLTEIHS